MKVACVQMTSACDPADNLREIDARTRAAAAAGAELVSLPETCISMEKNRKAMRARLQPEAESASLHVLCGLAKELGIHLLIGSMVLANDTQKGDAERAVNRSLYINPQGEIVAHYDKIHMFDVTLASGETHAESHNYQAGSRAVVADVGPAKLGLSICYDLRFAALYRHLAQAGADIISVPSAFTRPTGEAHWQVLLRARAIETGCFVIAPAQVGTHENGRETYGHSLIVDPWGTVLAQADDTDDFILAELDLSLVAKARGQIPALTHGQTFVGPDGREVTD
ncbi:MAG: carbon-nitrogen hydrolase family protein [Rhodobiaceae bacterium]|jgi:predicted amidohydrolase|nr:carbon-nitrogen hydrolase family protein [Rhodobiaceae bacterium]